MLKFYKFALLLLLSSGYCAAQQNFKNGYVVTLSGDTLKGYIDYHEWRASPQKIKFKKELSAQQATEFGIDNAAAFAVTGLETYCKFTVSISNGTTSLTDANVFIDTTSHTATVFLKQLISGDKLSLYSYTDQVKTRFYAAEPGTDPRELLLSIYDDKDGAGLRYSYRYRTQLIYYAQKLNNHPPTTEEKIMHARYDEPDLIRVMRLLNSTVSNKLGAKAQAGTRFFVGLGVNYNKLSFSGSYATDIYNINIKNTPYPFLSGGFDIFPNNTTRQFFFRVEAILTAGHSTTFDDIQYSQYTAGLNPQFGFNFYNTQKLKVFATIGININESAYKTAKNNSSTAAAFTYNNLGFKSLWFAPGFKAGVKLNQRFDIFGAYVLTSPISDYLYLNGQISTIQAGVHYFFGAN